MPPGLLGERDGIFADAQLATGSPSRRTDVYPLRYVLLNSARASPSAADIVGDALL